MDITTAEQPALRIGRVPLTSEALGWSALTVMLLSSATYNAFAKSLTGALTPLSLVFLSELIAASAILFSHGILPVLRAYRAFPRHKILPLISVGVASGFTASSLLFAGLQRTSAVNTTLFGNTEMLFLMVLAVLFLHERLRAIHFASMTAIAIGLLLISFRGFTETFMPHSGDILVLLSSFVYSIGDLLFRKYLHNVETHIVILSRAIVAMTGFGVVTLLWPQPIVAEIRAFPLSLLWVLLSFALVSRLLNITCFYQALDRLPVTTVSLFANLSIVFSIVFANWYLGEPIMGYQILGGAFIILGTLLLEAVGGHHPSPAHHEAHLRQRHAQRV